MPARALSISLCGALLIAVTALLPWSAKAQTAAMQRDELVIETDAAEHRFVVELARTPEQRALGLMFREQMPADAGMLFIYSQERPVGMWMKNTLIPLDMLFIASDGRIVEIAERTVPMSTKLIEAGQPVRAVLELNGGTADRLGISAGDRVRYDIFSAE